MTKNLIRIKHHLSSGCCMWSGIEDIYAMKTNQKVPEGFLLALSSFGETVFLKMNNRDKPFMFSANDARPKKVYENIKVELGLEYKIVGGRTVEFALKSIKKEIDNERPVILGPLDMFYLPYLKMYHKEHIPIHFVMMVGYDESKDCVYIYDCDREDLIELTISDLRSAWKIEKNAVGDINGFIKFKLYDNLPTRYELMNSCLKKKAERQLCEKPYIVGVSAYEKIAKVFPKWERIFSEDEYKRALISITEFMGRVPKIPNKILGVDDIDIPYKANYDRLSSILKEMGNEYNCKEWVEVAELFEKCGDNIEKIVNYIVQYCCEGENNLKRVPGLFMENRDYAYKAYNILAN